MKRISTLAVLVLCSAFFSSNAFSGDNHKHKADHVTGASKHAHKTDAMPPESADYKVFTVDGVKNYIVKYDDKMYRGGEIQTEAGAKALKDRGIKTIVSITPTDEERAMAKKFGFKLVEMEFTKTTGVSADQLKAYLDMVHNEDGPFYVHCHGGNHRAGILAAAYRIHEKKWPKDKALLEFGYLGGSLKNDYVMIASISN